MVFGSMSSQGVFEVEIAHEWDSQLQRPTGEGDSRIGAVQLDSGLFETDFRSALALARDANELRPHPFGGADECVCARVIDVHHSRSVCAKVGIEEPNLGGPIGVHRIVKVEMILTDIGQRGDRESTTSNAIESQAVGRNLHDRALDAVIPHRAQVALNLVALRCRVDGGLPLTRVADVESSDHPDRNARAL